MNNLEELKKQYEKLGKEIEKLESELKLYDVVKFGNLEWYVIDEDNTSYTLFLKDKFSPEQCVKYFDNSLLDDDKDVLFNMLYENNWWSDSPIRMALNSEFLKDLELTDMELMETTVEINGQSRATEDYVRLITKNEVEELPIEIRKCSGEYGYWTMSPSHFYYWGNAYEFIVTSAGALSNYIVYNGYGVRPVIKIEKGGDK